MKTQHTRTVSISNRRPSFFNPARQIPDSHREVVGGPLGVPIIGKLPGTDGKLVTAVSFANFKHRAENGLAFRDQLLEFSICTIPSFQSIASISATVTGWVVPRFNPN